MPRGKRPPEPLPEPGDPEDVRCHGGAPGCTGFRSLHLGQGVRTCPACDSPAPPHTEG